MKLKRTKQTVYQTAKVGKFTLSQGYPHEVPDPLTSVLYEVKLPNTSP